MPLLIAVGSFYVVPGVRHTGLLAGFTPEFMGRKEGYLDLRSVYNLGINPVVINGAVMYKAAYEKDLDVISGYSTNGRIKVYNLSTLDDDKHIFPPYHAPVIIRSATFSNTPGMKKSLTCLLAGSMIL